MMWDPFDFNGDGERSIAESYVEYKIFEEVTGENDDDEEDMDYE